MTSAQLNEKIHDTFDLVRKSVETELSKGQAMSESDGALPMPARNSQSDEPASPKQVSYLLALARQKGIDPKRIAAEFHVPDVFSLTKKQCSGLIECWKDGAK